MEIERTVGTHADHAEICIAHHDWVSGAPSISGEETCVDKIHVRFERRFKSVFPALERGQDRDVVRRQGVGSRSVGIAELALLNKLSHLRLAHDELCAPLDLFVLVRITEGERISGIVLPLDNFKELRF